MDKKLGILTPEEVAEELKVTPLMVVAEMEAGRLKGFQVGGEWRTTEEALRDMIMSLLNTSSLIATHSNDNQHENTISKQTKGVPTLEELRAMQWERIDPFNFLWPKQTEGEPYQEAYRLRLQVGEVLVPLVLGFCDREGAGMADRRRAVLFWGEIGQSLYPVVEFTGANDFETTGTLVSPIRSDGRKSARPNEPIPVGYEDMPLGIYNQFVIGPYARWSRCVVAYKTDFAVMARHALLRCQQKGWL